MSWKNRKSSSSGRRRGRNGGRRGPNGRRGGGGSLRNVLLASAIALVPLTALAGGGYVAYNHFNTMHIHKASYCFDDLQQPQSAIFVDFSFTDAASDSQGRDLINALHAAYKTTPVNGKVSIFTTSSQSVSSIPVPEFEICRPATTNAERERIGAPTATFTVLERQAKEAEDKYKARIQQLFRDSKDPSKVAKDSPILEQIRGISRYVFNGPLQKLYLYTDGIQNSENGRFCQKAGELPSFRKYSQRPAYRFLKPDSFSGVDIEMLIVEWGTLPSTSLPYCTNQEIWRFYDDMFVANDASSVRITPLRLGS